MPFQDELKKKIFEALLASKNNLMGSPETGRGLLSGQNVMDAGKQIGQQVGDAAKVLNIPTQIPESIRGLGKFTPYGALKEAYTSPAGMRLAALQAGVSPEATTPENIATVSSMARSTGAPTVPQQATPEIPTEAPMGEEKKGLPGWAQALIKMGVPIGAVIAGSANPDLLPQMSGLSTGYVKGIHREEDRGDKLREQEAEDQGKDEITLVDPDGNTRVVKRSKGSKVIKADFVFPQAKKALTKEQNKLVIDNMKAYPNKSKEEIIKALTAKGLI